MPNPLLEVVLLHDLFFYDWRDTKFNKSHAWIHPRIAVRNAQKLTSLNKIEKDIIIVKHMFWATIAPPRYKEAWIVTCVDKYWLQEKRPIGNISGNGRFFVWKCHKQVFKGDISWITIQSLWSSLRLQPSTASFCKNLWLCSCRCGSFRPCSLFVPNSIFWSNP